MIKPAHRLFALATLALLLLPALSARAQTVINSLPYTISTPGDYVLGGNLTFNNPGSSGGTTAAITFAVGNVTLDFAGHYISGLGAGKGTLAYGLYGLNRANITVQNGSIVGFLYGIFFDGTSPGSSGANNTGNVVTNMRLPSNTYVGISLNNPTTCRVEGCQVNKTGGSMIYGANTGAVGISVSGGSATIKNNQVSITTGVGNGTGYGIFCGISANHFVIGNQVDTCGVGVRMDPNASTGLFQSNLATSITTTFFQGGPDAGGNVGR